MTIPAPGLRPAPVGPQPVPGWAGAPGPPAPGGPPGPARPAAPGGLPTTSAGSGDDLCRLTVLGPAGRMDLAVPTSATPDTVLPLIVRHLAGRPGETPPAGTGWVLQRLGERPLDRDARIDVLELLDGDVLYLRPADDPIPELRHDDVADGLTSAAGTSTGHRTEATARLLRGLGGFAFAVAAAVLVVGLPADAVAPMAAAVAAVLVGGAVLLARGAAQPDAALVAGLGGIGFAVLAGLCAPGGPAGALTPGAPGLLLAALGAVCCAAVLLVAGLAPVAFGVAAGLAVLTVATVAVAAWFASSAGAALATVAVTVFVAGTVGPRAAVRMARLRVPLLPRSAPELQDDIEPVSGSTIARRTVQADRLLSVLSICSAVLVALAALALLAGPDWIHWVLPAVLGLAALLRARAMGGVVQRAVLTWGGAVALGVVLVGRAADGPLGLVLGLLVAALVAAGALLVVSWRMPGRRLLPIWGHVADITELWTALVLVPLLLQLHDVYAIFRGLNG